MRRLAVGSCVALLFGALGCGESFSSAPAGDAAGGSGGGSGAGGSGGNPPRALVLNEVDYENPTLDTMEFIEIFNPGSTAAQLDDIHLVLVNGASSANTEYARFALSGTLGPGQYLVVGSPAVVVPPTAKSVLFDLDENQIQNAGDAPDAIGLLDVSKGALVDALSYGGEVRDGAISGAGSFDFVEGSATTVTDPGVGAMIRVPNGNDTNDAIADWQLTQTPTPGLENSQ